MFSYTPFGIPWERQPGTPSQVHPSLMEYGPLVGFVGTWGLPDLPCLMALSGSRFEAVQSGMAVAHTASGDKTHLLIDSKVMPTESITILMHYQKRDTTARASAAFGVAGSDANERCGVHLPWSDGNVYWDFGGTSAPNRVTVSSLTFGDDVWAFTAGKRGQEVFQNGVRVGSESTAATRTTAVSTLTFSLGHHATTADSDLGNYYSLVMFREQIPLETLVQITRTKRSYYGRTFAPLDLFGFKVAGGVSINGPLIGGKLLRGGILIGGRLV